MANSPSTDNYTLGKGIVYFNRKDNDTGLYTGERDLGNAPAFSFNIALEKLEHFSSRGGLKAKDKEIISQITPGISFTLDEVNAENLALLTLADVETVSQTGASVTDEAHKGYKGKRIELAFRDISSVTITNASDSDTPLVSGQDFSVVAAMKDDAIGRVYILPTATNVTDGDNLEISYTYGTITYTRVKAFAQTQVEGFLRFVSDNPAGTQQELQIWRVSLTPAGDTAMIGDDWSTLGFTGEVLKDEAGHSDSPYMDIILDQE
jgi:hypothetical protein